MGFFDNMLTVFVQVIMLAVLVVIGIAGDRIGFFTEKAARLSNDLLFYVITPCVIVTSFLKVGYTPQNARGFFSALACATVFHIVAVCVSFLVFNKGDSDKNVIYKYAVTYGNTGYMGLPMSAAVMGAVCNNSELGLFYCSAAVVSFQLFCYTHGVWLMSKSKNGFDWKKLILNPGALSVLVALPLFFFDIKLPQIIFTPMNQLASMNTPFAMVMFGTYLSKADFKGALMSKNMYFAAAIKLIIVPVLVICGFRLCGVRGALLIVSSVFVSVPSANNTAMFAAKYGRDASLASQVSGFISLISVITLPACIALAVVLS